MVFYSALAACSAFQLPVLGECSNDTVSISVHQCRLVVQLPFLGHRFLLLHHSASLRVSCSNFDRVESRPCHGSLQA